MDKLISFWAAPDWRLLGFMVGILLVLVFGVYWAFKIRVKNKEEKQKKNAVTLGDEQINQLFKIRKVEKDRNLGFLSADPTSEHYWGTGDPTWVNLENFPDDLKLEGRVVKVTKEPDGIKIVSIQLHRLPTEKETLEVKKDKAAKVAEEEAKALELEKAKKKT